MREEPQPTTMRTERIGHVSRHSSPLRLHQWRGAGIHRKNAGKKRAEQTERSDTPTTVSKRIVLFCFVFRPINRPAASGIPRHASSCQKRNVTKRNESKRNEMKRVK